MHSHQTDRSLASLESSRLRNSSNRDNSFKTARNIGTLFPSRFAQAVRASGSIGKSDRSDYYKVLLQPGFSSSIASGQLTVRGGALRYSIFADIGAGIQSVFRQRVTAGSYALTNDQVPLVPSQATLYIVFDRPTRNVRYRYERTYQP